MERRWLLMTVLVLASALAAWAWRPGVPDRPSQRAAPLTSVRNFSPARDSEPPSSPPPQATGPFRSAALSARPSEPRAAVVGSVHAVAPLRKGEAEPTPEHEAAVELTRYITNALEDLNIDGDLDNLECGETQCRVNLHFADMANANAFEQAAAMLERRKSMELSMADGQLDVEVVLSRE